MSSQVGDDSAVSVADNSIPGNNKKDIDAALRQGEQAWMHSKIMIVGRGRAGKTALSRAMSGQPFEETESTIGVNQLTLAVRHQDVDSEGLWEPCDEPTKQLEWALAKMIKSGVQKADKNDQIAATRIISSTHSTVRKEGRGVNKKFKIEDVSKVGVESKVDVISADVDVDEGFVVKCLADKVLTESKLRLSIFDFGGQDVFNVIHHLFLTKYGVYTLVFRMTELASFATAQVRDDALAYLAFWVNSILVHTYSEDTGRAAHIFLIGTRKDEVADYSEHKYISDLLEGMFSGGKAGPSIVENAEDLYFFPVDNTKGRNDPIILRLMKLIDSTIADADYVKRKLPLNWFKTFDTMTASSQKCLSLTDVHNMAAKSGMSGRKVPFLLQFLHEMGYLMWHDEEGLREVVVMDPVAFFVMPATRIICKHNPNATDDTVHHGEVHKYCKKNHRANWDRMVTSGVVEESLLTPLLRDYEEHIDVIKCLMLKFGLIVAVETHLSGTSSQICYLVPALLPVATPGDAIDALTGSRSVYFVFSIDTSLEKSSASGLIREDLRGKGFLPRGLFQRFVGKALYWYQKTCRTFDLRDLTLFQDLVVLSFGSQRFSLRADERLNVIEARISGQSPLAVHRRLSDLLQEAICECMKSLQFFSAIPYKFSTDEVNGALVSLDHARQWSTTGRPAKVHRAGVLSLQESSDMVDPWKLTTTTALSRYDVFISYRWGADSDTAKGVFDAFGYYTVSAGNRAVDVFLDHKRLKDGEDFQEAFADALSNSLMVVSLVSLDALHRMKNHKSSEEDNVLIEWLLAMELRNSRMKRVRAIVPLLIGPRTLGINSAGGGIAEFDFRAALASLSDSVNPTKSVEVVVAVLRRMQVQPSDWLTSPTLSVWGAVAALTKCQGIKASDYPPPLGLEACVASRVMETLDKLVNDSTDASQATRGPAALLMSPTPQGQRRPVSRGTAVVTGGDLSVSTNSSLLSAAEVSYQ